FAGTERGAFMSFDDGDNWEPLQLNLPVTSVRDFEIYGNDLIVVDYPEAAAVSRNNEIVAESARHLSARLRDLRQRSHCCDSRPRLLGNRRHQLASTSDAGDSRCRCVPVQAGRR